MRPAPKCARVLRRAPILCTQAQVCNNGSKRAGCEPGGRAPHCPQAPTRALPVYTDRPQQTLSRSLGDNGLGVFSGVFWGETLWPGREEKCLRGPCQGERPPSPHVLPAPPLPGHLSVPTRRSRGCEKALFLKSHTLDLGGPCPHSFMGSLAQWSWPGSEPRPGEPADAQTSLHMGVQGGL